MIKKYNPWVRFTVFVGVTLFSVSVWCLAIVGAVHICKLLGWLA